MKNFLKGRKIKGRYFLVGGLFLVAVFLAIPQDVLAVPWYLTPSGLFSAFISGILKVLLKLAGVFLEWMTQAVGWAVGNPFNISYTRPGPIPPDNFVIEIGWTLLRDLVNMGFILGLAFIGLSTALDFTNKFATGKTFFKLILIALLVNFTPAICGAVVDMGNILGSFFTQSIDFSTLNGIFNSQQGKIDKVWTNIITEGKVLLNAVSLIAFGFISAFTLFVYFVLFCARGPIIWFFVILSPVYFFAFIFDKTKKQFDKWWDNFIKWALVMPVVLGFFLYLSQQILVRVNEIMNVSGSSPSGFINQIMPYTLPIATLIIGLFLGTTKLMPSGGGAVMGLAKTAGAGAIGAAGAGIKMGSSAAGKGISATGSGVKAVGSGIGAAGDGVKALGSGIGALGNAALRIPYAGVAIGGALKFVGGATKVAGSATKAVGSATKAVGSATKVAGSAVKRAGASAGNAVGDAGKLAGRAVEGMEALGIGKGSGQTSDSKNLESAIEGMMGASAEAQKAAMKNPLPGVEGRLGEIAGTIAAIQSGNGLDNLDAPAKEGVIKDTIRFAPEQMPTIKNIAPEAIAKIIKETRPPEERQKQMGVFMTKEEIAKFSGHKYPDEKSGETKTLDPLAAKIMAEIKPNQMNAWGNDTAGKAAASGIANQLWGGSQVSKAAELFGSKFVDIFKQNIKSESFYAQNNKPMGDFIQSSASQALGLKFLSDNPIPTARKRQSPPAIAQKNPEKNLDSNIGPEKAA